MMPTYRAILENNQLQWIDEEPDADQKRQPLTVLVTIVEETQNGGINAPGENAAAILSRMAASNGLTEITDPVVWQRDSRKDRILPGRD